MSAHTAPTERRRLRGRVGGYARTGVPDDDPRVIAARRDLAVANLAAYIREIAATAPPPTPEQAAQLRALLPAPVEHDAADDGGEAA